MVERIISSYHKNEAGNQNSILERVKEWNQVNVKTKQMINSESGSDWRMKSSECKNEVDNRNSIYEQVKEWNQVNVKTKQMVIIRSWSEWKNNIKSA